MVAAYVGFALFLLGMVLGGTGRPPILVLTLALPGFAVFGGAILCVFLFLRCPNCREMIGHTVSYSGNPFSIPKKIRFCPCCGISLDSDLPKRQSP
jgi:hypothetical protein